MSDASGTNHRDETVVALANTFAALVTGERPIREGTVSGLLRRLASEPCDPLVLAASVGAAWAAASSVQDPPEDEVLHAAVTSARALAGEGGSDSSVVLGAAALGLLAALEAPHTLAADLLFSAGCARSVERHDLCSALAREALVRGADLTTSQIAHAMLLIAVVDRDPSEVGDALGAAYRLPEDDPVRQLAERLEPTLPQPAKAGRGAVARAVNDGNRRAAAAGLRDELELLRRTTDDDLLRGMVHALDALSGDETQVDDARTAFELIWKHWRKRSRLGVTPPVALAGIEILLDLLILEPDPARADLLVELAEALADSGVATIAGTDEAPALGDLPSIVEAQLSRAAAHDASWPNLRDLLDGAGASDILYLRTRRRMTDGGLEVLILHVVPPDGVSIRTHHLTSAQLETVRTLSGRTGPLLRITPATVDDLVHAMLPKTLQARLEGQAATGVAVIPDAVMWPVPWGSAAALARTPVTIVQSLTALNSSPDPMARVGSIVALVDEEIPEAAIVLQALRRLDSAGIPVAHARSVAEAATHRHRDLLVVYCHGGGRGLDYQLALPGGATGAFELAASRLAPRAIIAACSSGGPAPPGLPLSLATALLVHGTSSILAGLWPLPVRSTARLLADLLAEVGRGANLTDAWRASRTLAQPVLENWGVHHFGRFEPSLIDQGPT